MKDVFAELPPTAEVQARYQYEGRELHTTWSLSLLNSRSGVEITTLGLTAEGGAGVTLEENRDRRVEVWAGRSLQDNDDYKFMDVALILEIATSDGPDRVTKVGWVMHGYQPPTPMWMADKVDIPLVNDSKLKKTVRWTAVVKDKSLFPSTGDITLNIAMQR
jgi:hypothetical protein